MPGFVSSSLERAPAPIPRNGADVAADLARESSDIVHTSRDRLDAHADAARGRAGERGAGRAGAHRTGPADSTDPAVVAVACFADPGRDALWMDAAVLV